MGFVADALGMKPPTPPAPPPPPPVVPPTVEDTMLKAAQDSDAMRKRQGRASTVLAGNQSTSGSGTPQTATNALLGS